jgi:hypothetical protein
MSGSFRYFRDPAFLTALALYLVNRGLLREVRRNNRSANSGRMNSRLQRRKVRLRGLECLFWRESLKPLTLGHVGFFHDYFKESGGITP